MTMTSKQQHEQKEDTATTKGKGAKKETEDPYATLIATANAATTSTPNIPSLFAFQSRSVSLPSSSDECSPPAMYRTMGATPPPPLSMDDVPERSPPRLMSDKVPPRFKRHRESRSSSPSKAKQGGGVQGVPQLPPHGAHHGLRGNMGNMVPPPHVVLEQGGHGLPVPPPQSWIPKWYISRNA